MKERYAKGQLNKDIKYVLSLIEPDYIHIAEVDRVKVTLHDSPSSLAFHFARHTYGLHLVPLPKGCKDKRFKDTQVICWNCVDGDWIRTKHLPGLCPYDPINLKPKEGL
jgi:hypothetical protein